MVAAFVAFFPACDANNPRNRFEPGIIVECAAPVVPLDCGAPPVVDTDSLLDEMIDLDALARPTCTPYRTFETSSTDPRAVAPGEPGWFANIDWGHYPRVDVMPDGRVEKVMLDADGPGAVVRMWTASDDGGTLRVYLDGADEPSLVADFVPLLEGEIAPFTGPFARVTSFGRNLDFPFPFRGHIKITVENPGAGDYWYVIHRRYSDGVDVRSYDGRLDLAHLATVRDGLDGRLPAFERGELVRGDGGVRVTAAPGGSAIHELRVVPARRGAGALRGAILTMRFDGRETVRVPLGDFFGIGPGFHPHRTLPVEVTGGGAFISRLVMPFACDAEIAVEGGDAVVAVRHHPTPFVDGSMHLAARWIARDLPTRPMRDVTVADVAGRGRWIGTMLSVDSRSREWWGEGDEKVWVDDDAFPSWFGTGTEDYFGYAYSTREPFDHAYRTLRPTGDGRGQVASARFHVLDAIPFAAGLRFDLELFHWDANATLGYDTLGYFYLAPD